MSPAPGVLILATAADTRWLELLQRYLETQDATRFPLLVLAPPESPLQHFDGRGQIRVLGCTSAMRGKAAQAWSLLREIRRLDARTPLGVVATDSEAEHWAAAAFKLLARHPVAVLKTRFDPRPLPSHWRKRWLHNRLTAVNLFLSRDDEHTMRDASARKNLWLDNPCTLAQPALGGGSAERMLAHNFAALLQPTRDDPVSGPRRDLSHIELAYVTHFYLNQQGKASVLDLLARYASYDPALLDRIQFVIVDDGSPLAVEPPDLPLNLTWLRVREDIPWNMAGARNLGAVYAGCDKMLITDVDHEFPEEVLRRLVARGACGKRIYKFWRRDPGGSVYKCHPNVFLLSRGRYFELYGYDEEFAGAYGAEDVRFMKYQKAHGSLPLYLPRRYWCIERADIDRKTAYHSLVRDVGINTPVDSRKRLELEHYGPAAGHSRAFLNFHWEVVANRWRDVRVQFPERRWFKRLQALRQVLPRF